MAVKHKLRLLPLLLCAVLLMGATPAEDIILPEDLPEGFTHRTGVFDIDKTGPAEYKAFRLTPEIYNATDEDLVDLLVYADGTVQPYFLNSWELKKTADSCSYPMAQADSFLKDEDQFLDYQAQELPNEDLLATSIHVEADGQFVKEVELLGSYDGAKWESVGHDTLYRVEDSRKLSINFAGEQKYSWYRFRLVGNQQPVTFTNVWLQYDMELAQTQSFTEDYLPAFTVAEEGTDTVVSLQGLRNVPLAELMIVTNSTFKRTVRVAHITETLYSLPFAGNTFQRLAVPMNGYQSAGDTLELRIRNGDDTPINIISVQARYYAWDVVFKNPSANAATLYFGNSQITTPPRYDIASYQEFVLAQGYDLLPFAHIQVLSEPEQSVEPKDYTKVLNVVVTAAAVLLAAIILLMMRKRN